MARAVVIVLALANLGYLAWSMGALAAFDLAPAHRAATEPHRLARQILPGRLRIVTPEQAREEDRARAQAEAEAQARRAAGTREIRTTASATRAGTGAVIGVSEPVVLSVAPASAEPAEPVDPPGQPASTAASASGPSWPAATPR